MYLTGDRDIKSLKVYCDNKADGCKWTGELRSLEAHLTVCDFSFIPCPNQCSDFSGKIVKVLVKELKKHKLICPRRQHMCRHCKEVGEFADITTFHLQKCPNLKVTCPNTSCRKRVFRRDVTNHRKECLFEEVPCKYARIGCNARVPRREREEHESNAEQHLQLAVDTVSDLKSKLDEQQAVIFMLKNFNKVKSDKKCVSFRPFYTSPGGYKMRIKVCVSGVLRCENHVYVSATLLPGENDDNLPWPFTGTVVVELLNQLEDANHHVEHIVYNRESRSSLRPYDMKADSASIYNWFITQTALNYNAAEHRQYLKDDCLCFRIRVMAPSPLPWLK